MSITAIALLAVLNGAPDQDPAAPRVETRSEIRIITADGQGPGRLDKDGDGVITREEFSAPMGDAFDRLDADHDGRLSTEELAAGHGGPDGPGHRAMMLGGPGGPGFQVFTLRSGPGGGPMPGGPGHVFVRRLGGPDGPGEMDKNGDGRVSQDEFLAPLIETFQRMDADRDGFLDEGEGRPAPPPAD